MGACMLEISLIRRDGGTQPRERLVTDHAYELCEVVERGERLQPVVVFNDGTDYWLADGFHRVRAYELAEQAALPAEVRQGSRRDAVLYSCGANARHGLKRSNDDKRRAVQVLLEDPEWSQWSDREIARRAGVGNAMVSRLRKELLPPDGVHGVSKTQREHPKRAAVATALDELGDDATVREVAEAAGVSVGLVSKVKKARAQLEAGDAEAIAAGLDRVEAAASETPGSAEVQITPRAPQAQVEHSGGSEECPGSTAPVITPDEPDPDPVVVPDGLPEHVAVALDLGHRGKVLAAQVKRGLASYRQALDELNREVRRWAGDDRRRLDSMRQFLPGEHEIEAFRGFATALESFGPHCACPACEGRGYAASGARCVACHGAGWIDRNKARELGR